MLINTKKWMFFNVFKKKSLKFSSLIKISLKQNCFVFDSRRASDSDLQPNFDLTANPATLHPPDYHSTATLVTNRSR